MFLTAVTSFSNNMLRNNFADLVSTRRGEYLIRRGDKFTAARRLLWQRKFADVKILMGDFNAQIGPDRTGFENVMGKEAMGRRTDNGERLLSMCSSNELKVGGSIFAHKHIHKGTWRSPDGSTVNQIDHICISWRWTSALQDVRVYHGTDVASDHYLLVAKLKMKLKCRDKSRTLHFSLIFSFATSK